jgi:hypothetical protein
LLDYGDGTSTDKDLLLGAMRKYESIITIIESNVNFKRVIKETKSAIIIERK